MGGRFFYVKIFSFLFGSVKIIPILASSNKQTNTKIMESVMISAVKVYAELTNRTFKEVATEMQTNKVVQESILMLMFSVSK